ncbi:MAG: iron-sulfur cluster assembly accessory protein [Actinobacteria bacterium]|nr:iron-sulfur cluster assembly accessory protein [Actinomycetota bacterium]
MAAVETSDPRAEAPLEVAEGAHVISLTDRAARMFGEILASKGVAEAGLKVAVVGGGCSGYQYAMALARRPEDTDIVTEANGVPVYLDGYTAHLLVGAEIDFVDSMMGRGFTVRNPNAQATCGCGSSFNTSGAAPKVGGCGTCST